MTKNQNNTVTINVATKFSRFPSGRTPEDSKYSGQLFREKHLIEPLGIGKFVKIELDGPIGYGSSFLDEAFGGLVRDCGFTVDFLRKHLDFITYDTALASEIWSYIEDA